MATYRFTRDVVCVLHGQTGRHFQGEEVQAEPAEVAALVALGDLVLAPAEVVHEPDDVDEKPAKKRRTKKE